MEQLFALRDRLSNILAECGAFPRDVSKIKAITRKIPREEKVLTRYKNLLERIRAQIFLLEQNLGESACQSSDSRTRIVETSERLLEHVLSFIQQFVNDQA